MGIILSFQVWWQNLPRAFWVTRFILAIADINMANAFDPYREALVMEQVTVWGPLKDQVDPAEQEKIALKLHTAAEDACELEYQRTHTGFCRVITVTEDDIQRLQASRS